MKHSFRIAFISLGLLYSCNVQNVKQSASSTTSQSISPSVYDATPLSKYMKKIQAKKLKTLLYTIASPKMEGRNTGSEGQKKAGRYMINFYKNHQIPYPTKLGSYYQNIPAGALISKKGKSLGASENILAFIEGSQNPNEIVVISAHYDHIGIEEGKIFAGADDDGSGTVALMEIAKVLQLAKKEGNGPKRSVLILHVTGEEKGLLGSDYYSKNPVFDLKNTVADINIDMIGRIDPSHENSPNYIYVVGSDRLSSELHQINEEMNQKYTKMDLDYKYNDRNDPERIYFRSDHYNFAKHGIPSLFYFNGIHADYHKYTDTPEKINYKLLEKRAQLAFATVWELANRPNRIVADKNGE